MALLSKQNKTKMKKIYLLCLMLFATLASTAQDFEILSVESLPNDFAAREEIKTDHNDRQCALLRIATQSITPEQRELFTFKTDLGSEVVERATRNGEIWLWVSPGLKYLRIMHRDWGQYELHLLDHVSRVEALHTYKITIHGTELGKDRITQQYLMFQITPANALLEVDGQLWSVDADGTAMKYVDFGTYNYRVMASDYFTETGKVTVDDPENTKVVPVTLKPNFAEITLAVDADAEIWVNNQKKGTRRWTGSLGNGTYKIECKQANHETSMVSKEITPAMNGETITLPAPTPIYGSLNIESTPNLATIYIDGKEVGKTPKSIPQIIIGEHELCLVKDGYNNHIEMLTIIKGERIQVQVVMNNMDYEKIAKKGDEYFDAKNYEEALKCYREAAEYGNALGQNGMGRLYSAGFAVKQDDTEAAKWFGKAAEQGLDRAYNNLGYLYSNGKGVNQNLFEAVKCFRKAAELGLPSAQFNLGYMYDNGIGVTADETEALKWYRMAAEQGNSYGQTIVGRKVFYGKDKEEGLKWLRMAAEQNNIEAQKELAYIYWGNRGIEEDSVEVVRWFRKAADLGDSEAQWRLGDIYHNACDYKEAVKWYCLAHENGYDCSSVLGNIYKRGGYGVKKDYAEAIKWFRIGTTGCGWAHPQEELAEMYEYGLGVKRDLAEAIKLYKRLADPDYGQRFTEKVAKLTKRLTREASESHSKDETFLVNGVSVTMRFVEGGSFMMGSNNDYEKPVHNVTLNSFYIGESEVTQALWEAVMGSNPSKRKDDIRPVEQVSWNDCQDFIAKLNRMTGKKFRLPTEAEWEYAARGGKKSKGYEYAGSNIIDSVAHCNSWGGLWYVETLLPNELGLYDMSGNVGEWCQDWYGDYDYNTNNQNNPQGPASGIGRVVRGGNTRSKAVECRVSCRSWNYPDNRNEYTGLRIVLVP